MAERDTIEHVPGRYLYTVPGMHEEEDGVLYLASTPKHHLEKIKDLDLTPDDLLIATFSKSGTTWTQEVAYLISNGVDSSDAQSRPITERVPFIDYEAMWPLVMTLQGPCIFKTHLRPHYFQKQILEQKAKVVLMMRNPKDTLVSFYHFYKINKAFGCFSGSWDEFFMLVSKKQLIYGDWFDYTKSWWKFREEPNILVLKYEDMLRSPEESISQLARFMGKSLSHDQVGRIAELTSFKKMKQNSSVSYSGRDDFLIPGSDFMRKGSIGDWKNYFTVAQNEYFDDWFNREMDGIGLEFTYEI